MKKSCYIIFLVLTFYLAGVYRASALMVLFFTGLFLLAVMFLLSRHLSGRMEVKMELESDTMQKGDSVTGRIWVFNKSWIPVPRFEVDLEYRHQGTSGTDTKTLYGYMAGRKPVSIEFQISSKYCGILHTGIRVVRTYDYLTLFCGSKKSVVDLRVLVLPAGRPMKIAADWSGAVMYPSGGEPKPELPGNQPPEMYQIRQYQDGDSIRDIHWKLSAKMNQMMSRQYAGERQCIATVYLDLGKNGDGHIGRRDAFFELAASVLHGFLEEDTECRVCWYDMEKRCASEKMIRGAKDYREMLKELILSSLYSGDEGGYNAKLPETHRFWRPGETFLCLNMKLQLFLNQEFIMQFSEDNYEQEIEKRWLSV